jgi:hypothetical protein
VNSFFHIFDFDYTLYKTFERVKVWSPRGDCLEGGKPCFSLDPSEFHHFKIGRDEHINDSSFAEFNNVNWEKAIPILPTLFIFNQCSNKMILTSRSQDIESEIRKKIKDSFDFVGLGKTEGIHKINFIKNLKKDNAIMYDDSSEVINLCNKEGIKNVKVTNFKKKTTLDFKISL